MDAVTAAGATDHDTRTRSRWQSLGVRVGAIVAGEIAIVLLLTILLFPSIWAVLVAVVDIDQSAGPDVGVVLSEVANHPEVMWSQTVTISGRVDRLIGSQAMIVGNDARFVGDTVLVVAPTSLASLLVSQSAEIDEDAVIRVTGSVRPATEIGTVTGFGTDAAQADLGGYDGKAMLVAETLELNPPMNLGPGDKEFVAGSSGYDIAITINDIAQDPDEYIGKTVYVSDEIEEGLLTPHAFRIGDELLLVVSAEPHPELFIEATAYVAGEVRAFDLAQIEAEIGVDFEDARFVDFAGDPVVVAGTVAMVT